MWINFIHIILYNYNISHKRERKKNYVPQCVHVHMVCLKLYSWFAKEKKFPSVEKSSMLLLFHLKVEREREGLDPSFYNPEENTLQAPAKQGGIIHIH